MTLDEELIKNAKEGNLDKVHDLLRGGANVNAKDRFGFTALMYASVNGHLEVVRALLMHNGVDVNIKNMFGDTALILASYWGHLEVVRSLLNHNGVDVSIKDKYGDTALMCARNQKRDDVTHLLEEHMDREKLRTEKELNPHKKHKAETPASEEKRPSSTDVAFEKDHELLLHVMNTPSADPVELSLEFIERCIKKDHDGKPIKLGSGGYGDVFLAEDSRLPKKFAVKIMRTKTHCNEADIKELRRSFQRELSTLKRFRHPSIIILYGYSLNVDSTMQYLVYEYAAHGSLADFFTDDGNRARLSADVRLSIMFELTRAVHFLHTGGGKVAGEGWKVFHRDIKSANICLADDFTPRLIGCGLAEFVPDDKSSATPGLSTVTLQSITGGFAFGTPGYICPNYLRKTGMGLPCPYIAAYDVYSIGVVLVELILGRLTYSRNASQFLDLFGKYVQDRTYHRIVDGWRKLMGDADPTVMWNPDALEIACKAAIWCLDPFPEERLSTKDLLNKLRDAVLSNTDAGIQHPVAASAVNSGPYCLICNEYRTDIKCSEGHALCTFCIVDMLVYESDSELKCLIKECSSKIQDHDLYGRIPLEMYKRYVKKRDDQTKLDEYLRQLHLVRSDLHEELGDDNEEEKPCRQELLNRRPAGSGVDHRVAVDLPRRDDDSPSIDEAKIEQDRSKLLHVMNTPSADPVELSLEYVELCVKKDHKLGSGGYGDVFLAEDNRLPKKFAVKMIRTKTHCTEADIKELRRSFQRELSTLKRSRHPNVIVLYGYSLNANSTQQCLVYEYAAHGSLAGFFTDDGDRACLSADVRLSIMYQLVRAVHFLHAGGCKVEGEGWNVFHRDIKSDNVCLVDDFTPRLIDCGLAIFVCDDNSSVVPESFPVSLLDNTHERVCGTPGYICPEYFGKKWRGLPCPYIAAYDVYSIGVVLVELILGCLNGVRSTRNDPQVLDVFGKYVQEERTYHRIVDGWKKLMGDADPTIMWNPGALEIACKAAIQCMDPFPENRLGTKDLLDKLRDALRLNSKRRYSAT